MGTNVFSPLSLVVEDAKSNPLFDITSINALSYTEGSYFNETLKYIQESDKEFNEYKKNLYKAITESQGSSDIIHESFADFFAGAKKLIDRFLAFIQSLYKKFITKLNGMIHSEKYLIKNKDQFNKFTTKDEFRFEGYNYTFDSSIPIINAMEDFQTEFDALELTDTKDPALVKAMADKAAGVYTAFIATLQESYYDVFRGKVLGSNLTFDSSDFDTALFEAYRNGSSTKEIIDVDHGYVTSAYIRFYGSDKLQKSVEATKKRIDREYGAIKKKIEALSSTKFDNSIKTMTVTGTAGTITDAGLMNTIDQLVKAKIDQVDNMSAIHALAFASKLDAIKECYKQDKAVLYKSLSKIVSVHKESLEIYSPNGGEKNDTDTEDLYDDVDIEDDDEEEVCEDPLYCPVPDDETEGEPELDDNGYEDGEAPTPVVDDTDTVPVEVPISDAEMKEAEEDLDEILDDLDNVDGPEIREAVYTAIHNHRLVGIVEASKVSHDDSVDIATDNKEVALNALSKIYDIKAGSMFDLPKIDQEIDIATNNITAYIGAEIDSNPMDAGTIEVAKENMQLYLKSLTKRRSELVYRTNTSKSIHEDYLSAAVYNIHLLEKMDAQQTSERIIKECLVFASSNNPSVVFNELSILNEGIGQSIKDGFTKVKNFIKKVWDKFVEKVTAFMAKEKTYLTKYKDIILKKKPKPGTYTIKQYSEGIKNIQNTPVPIFNYAGMDSVLKDEVTFQQSLVKGRTPAYDGKQEFAEYCKSLFTGGEDAKEIDASALNFTDMYNYCYNYEDIKNKLEKDKVIIEKAADEAGRLVDSLDREADNAAKAAGAAKTAEENKPAEEKPAENKPTEEKPAETVSASFSYLDSLTSKKYVYTELYGILSEADAAVTRTMDEPKANTSTAPAAGGGSTNDTNLSKNLNSTSGEKADKEAESQAMSGKLKEAKDKINIYLNNTTTLMTAKMTAAQETFTSYMKIIRFHVGDYINGDTGANQVAKAGTDYAKQVHETVGTDEEIKSMGKDAAIEKINKSSLPDKVKEACTDFIYKILGLNKEG